MASPWHLLILAGGLLVPAATWAEWKDGATHRSEREYAARHGRDREFEKAWRKDQKERYNDRREAWREAAKDRREAEREWRKDRRGAEREWQKQRREAEREWQKDLREAERKYREEDRRDKTYPDLY